jgi:uncharacterized coiled-coil protein SlyX
MDFEIIRSDGRKLTEVFIDIDTYNILQNQLLNLSVDFENFQRNTSETIENLQECIQLQEDKIDELKDIICQLQGSQLKENTNIFKRFVKSFEEVNKNWASSRELKRKNIKTIQMDLTE